MFVFFFEIVSRAQIRQAPIRVGLGLLLIELYIFSTWTNYIADLNLKSFLCF